MQLFSLRILKVIVNVAWWLLLPFYLFIFCVIVIKLFSGSYLQHDFTVLLKSVEHMPHITPASQIVRFNSIPSVESTMKIDMHMTPFIAAFVILAYSTFVYLTLGIIFHLRKIIKSVEKDSPFIIDNIRRLRLIGVFLIFIAVVNCLNSFFNKYLLTLFTDATDHYMVEINAGWPYLFSGLGVIVLSEIFRRGYELKIENESII